MKRVLTVTHYFAAHGGGVEVVAHQLLRQLAAQHPDWHFDWCASAGDNFPIDAPNLTHHAMSCWNGVEAKLGVPYPLWSPRAIAHLWRLVGACDAAHLHDFAYLSNALTALFCRLRGKPYLVTQHIGWVPYQSAILRAILRVAIKTLGRRVLGGAARVVFVSDVVARFFARRMKLRAQTIANGVDAQTFAPLGAAARAQLRRENGLDENAPIALFVGRFVEKKGVPLILKLAAQMPDVQFVFVGGGPLDPENRAPANARVWRNRRGVEVARAMQLADALILPSVGEGFPLVVQEALTCGTPVLVERSLASALPAVPRWLNVETLGRSDDAARWGAALRAITANRSASQSEAERAERAQWARQTWSWESCARQYGALLETLMAEAQA